MSADRHANPEGRRKFKSAEFAAWLQRWRDAEGFRWTELAERSGLSYSTVMAMSQGRTTSRASRQAAKANGLPETPSPSAETVARLADGLGLDVGYVMEKAGLGNRSDRWRFFNTAEREFLARILSNVAALRAETGDPLPDPMLKLLRELQESLPKIQEGPPE